MRGFRSSRWAFGVVRRVPRSPKQRGKEILLETVAVLLLLFLAISCIRRKSETASDEANATEEARMERFGNYLFRGILMFSLPMGNYMEELVPATTPAIVNGDTSGALSQSEEAVIRQTVLFNDRLQQELDRGDRDVTYSQPDKGDILSQASAEVMAMNRVSFAKRFQSMVDSGAWTSVYTQEMLGDYDTMRRLYKTASNTSVTSQELQFSSFLMEDLRLLPSSEGYQILIYHTHSQEAFADSPTAKKEHSIVAVGEELKRCLEQEGYRVLHVTESFDVVDGNVSRSGAYARAEPVIQSILEQNPTIEVVIDLHRDGVGENVHLIQELDGENAAKIMIFNGICRDTTAPLADVSNPYESINLAFGYQLRLAMDEIAPGLCRVNYLKCGRYNLHMCPKSILIEVGAQTNTMAEELHAMKYLAKALHFVLNDEEN